jgi:hypothetical protein
MTMYFANWIVLDLQDDTLGTNSTLFGDTTHIPGISTFILDIAVSDTRSTPQFPTMVHNDSQAYRCLFPKRDPFSSFNAISTHKVVGSILLYSLLMILLMILQMILNLFQQISPILWIFILHTMIFVLMRHPICSTLQWLLLSALCQRPHLTSCEAILVLVLWCFREGSMFK